MGLFGKKKIKDFDLEFQEPKPESPVKGVKAKFALWFAERMYREALAGEYGEETMTFLKSLSGLRTAILAVFLVIELLAQQFGFSAGPLFGVLHTIFGFLGSADPKEAFGVDPAVVASAIATLYFAGRRFVNHVKAARAKSA